MSFVQTVAWPRGLDGFSELDDKKVEKQILQRDAVAT